MAHILSYAALAVGMVNTVSALDIGQLVKTTSGAVIGHTSVRHGQVSEYLGNASLIFYLRRADFKLRNSICCSTSGKAPIHAPTKIQGRKHHKSR
jgi:hypothetical protein